MRRSFKILLLVLVSGYACSSAATVDPSRLWLPKKYRSYYSKLLVAAEVAEAQEGCQELLEGTLDLGQSEPERPIFRLLCRAVDGPNFNVMVDGNTRTPLTMAARVDALLTYEQKLERARLAEELKRREEQLARQQAEEQARQHQQALWTLCKEQFLEHTANLLEVQWLSPWPVDPQQIDEQGAEFLADFDALDPIGTQLRFRAECRAQADGSSQTTLKARR